MKIKYFVLVLNSLLLTISLSIFQNKLAIASVETQIAKQIGKQAGKFVVNPTMIGATILGILVVLLVGTFIYNAINK